jgi:hypothetical protein
VPRAAGEKLPGRNLPNLVGKAYGLVDLAITEASLALQGMYSMLKGV